jgi:hypothetical protein
MMTTFRLPDPYEGKGIDELKADCRRLFKICCDRERVIKETLGMLSDDEIEKLPAHARDYAKRLIAAYAE